VCGAQAHVRFTPNSDRESEIPQKVMSALPPKADMCSAVAHVCFGPDITYSITSSALASSDCGTVRPRVLAVLRLMTSSYLVGPCTGQLVPGSKRDDQSAINRLRRAPQHDQTAICGTGEGRDGALNLAGVTHADRAHIHTER